MRRLALTAAAALALTLSSQAQAPTAPRQPKPQKKERLRFTLILSRHGIRPPLTAAATLNARASDPWPSWPVPLGHLTPHGAEAITQMGAYMRTSLADAGLLSATICPTSRDIYLYADTDERNISSTRATFAALAPGCEALPIYTWRAPATLPSDPASPTTQMTLSRDPVFVPIAGHAFPPPPAEASLGAMRAALLRNPTLGLLAVYSMDDSTASLIPRSNPELSDLARILAPDPSHPAANPILNEPVEIIANPSGDPLITTRGPLPAASSLVEDLFLEYEDNKPLADVGWGRLGTTQQAAEATLRRLGPLHARAFSYSHRTAFFARAENSNILAHILDTLQQAAGTPASPAAMLVPVAAAKLDTSLNPDASPTARALSGADPDRVKRQAARPSTMSHRISKSPETRINGAFGPAGTKLVYISAHDTNLYGVAGLLGLHWTADGIANDTPPDSQIVFELWQSPHRLKKGETVADYPYTIRVRYRAQTLTQLRTASALTASNPPTEIDLQPTGCKSLRKCAFANFLHAARATIDPAFTQLDVPPTQLAKE